MSPNNRQTRCEASSNASRNWTNCAVGCDTTENPPYPHIRSTTTNGIPQWNSSVDSSSAGEEAGDQFPARWELSSPARDNEKPNGWTGVRRPYSFSLSMHPLEAMLSMPHCLVLGELALWNRHYVISSKKAVMRNIKQASQRPGGPAGAPEPHRAPCALLLETFDPDDWSRKIGPGRGRPAR